ncbi:hypothetical protein A0U94_03770 [Gluconobacter albidus]|uniref:glycosyltransferase family 2 protein n=1 Tax=Gluconobacter albidus TaxID=318683 RepID=UPI00098B9506|nr:glycosyltransferase family 2 protein [Gluconobacter albidus]AQS90229.1 hypothetical protein A0U94_03770 [Gluconobacter albidus]
MNDKTLQCACILMQRNEAELLEPWIQYHGTLFGYENLFIFDNGSDNPQVKRLLREYEDQGVHVDRQFSRSEDYPDKGKILTECAMRLNETKRYDFFFPLDCDEFLALRTDDGKISCEFSKIKNYLKSVTPSQTTYHVTRNYLNIVGHPNYFQEHTYSKVFFNNNLIVPLDHGSHLTSSSISVTPSDIVYIHCHAKPFATILAHSRDKLRPWVDVNNPKALEKFEADQGIGWHLVKYLRMSEKEYLNIFNKKNAIYIPTFIENFKHIGCPAYFLTGEVPENISPPEDRILIPGALHLNAPQYPTESTVFLAVSNLSDDTTDRMIYFFNAMGFETISADAEVGENYTIRSALHAGLWERLRLFSIIRTEKTRYLAVMGFSAEELSLISNLPITGIRHLVVLREPLESITGNREIMATAGRHLLSNQAERGMNTLRTALSSNIETLVLEESLIQTDPQSLIMAFLDFLGPDLKDDVDTDMLCRKLQYALPTRPQKDAFPLYEGWIDAISDTSVSGWCWRRHSNLPQIVSLIVDDHIVDVKIANIFRSDLLNAGIGSGCFGFHLSLPQDGPLSADRIQVRILKDNVRLKSTTETQEE